MLPDPLHPAVVHFPIVFAVILPVAALVALWAIRRGAGRLQAWFVPVLVAVAMTASGWFAKETGEQEEERVEKVAAEEPLHEHEEAADRFMLLAAVTTIILGGGLASGRIGSTARIVGTAIAFVVPVAAAQTGDLGGALVYEHGAASAYVDSATAVQDDEGSLGSEGDEEEDGVSESEDDDDEEHEDREGGP
jgi:uncharacterized membrane protein